MSLSKCKIPSALRWWSPQLMPRGYSPSWEKLNLVPEGEVTLEPEEKGELAAVSCRPPAERDRNHSFASSCVRSWEVGVYLDRQKSGQDELRTTLRKMCSQGLMIYIYIYYMYSKDDVWKIKSLYILKLRVSQNLFCYLAVFGENLSSFQFGGNCIRGTRLVNAQRNLPWAYL